MATLWSRTTTSDPHSDYSCELTVKTLDGQETKVLLLANNTVGELKEQIAKVFGAEFRYMSLVFAGAILKEENTLESYNLISGHVVYVINKRKPEEAG